MWRVILPLVALLSLVGCAANPGMNAVEDPFVETGATGGDAVGSDTVAPGSISGVLLSVTQAGLLQIGQEQAPHTLLLFITPQSPYSKEYVNTLLPDILRGPVSEGTLRVQIAFVPLQKYAGEDVATQTMICGSRQSAFEYRALTIVMENGLAFKDINPPGTEPNAFKECFGDRSTPTIAMNHGSIADSLGVTVVPTAFLDGERQVGLPDKTDLDAAIRRVTAE